MSKMSVSLLTSSRDVIRALVTYTDWWQPGSTSVMQVGPARRTQGTHDGMPPGLLDRLDERVELCRRMQSVDERDRWLLFLWYVRQLSVEDIACVLRISRRQCFRRRSGAIRKLVELGESDRAA